VVDAGELARRLAAMQEEVPREEAGWGITELGHRLSGKMKRAKSYAPQAKGKDVVRCEEVKGGRGRGWSFDGREEKRGWGRRWFGK